MTAGIAVAEHWPASKTTSNEKEMIQSVGVRSEPQHSILAGYFAPLGKSLRRRETPSLNTCCEIVKRSQPDPTTLWSDRTTSL
jgi:hypothetical protein